MSDEKIFGVDVSTMEADELANKFIRNDWVEIERALVTGKWFDYRFMNPVAATYLFAHEFKKAYRAAFAKNIDTETSEHITPLPEDLFTLPNTDRMPEKTAMKAIIARKSTISGIWRARQVADAMGMPYDIYLERAYYWALRYWQQRHLPRPTQLYSDRVIEAVAADWLEHQGARLYYSIKPAFMAANYDPRVKALDDHHEHLFELIASRGDSITVLARLLDEDLLPEEKARARLGDQMYQAACSISERATTLARYN